jgi:hypothetical protein
MTNRQRGWRWLYYVGFAGSGQVMAVPAFCGPGTDTILALMRLCVSLFLAVTAARGADEYRWAEAGRYCTTVFSVD